MRRPAAQAARGEIRRTRSRIIVRASGCEEALARRIRRVARRVFESEGVRGGELDVAVVGAAAMRRQNAHWLGENRDTDVLAFDLGEHRRSDRVEGQILVCAAVARRLAGSRPRDWQKELLLYVAHGCLHLCGYDDHRRTDAVRMHRREDELLSVLGLGPVYSRGGQTCEGVPR